MWFYRELFPPGLLYKATRRLWVALSVYCFCRRAAFFLGLPFDGPLEAQWDLSRSCLFSVSEWFYATAHIDACNNRAVQEYLRRVFCLRLHALEQTAGREDPFKWECVQSWATSQCWGSKEFAIQDVLPVGRQHAEETLVRGFPIFNRCVRCALGEECMVEPGHGLGECSPPELRYRCEPRAGVHLCNKHACRMLLPRTEKNRDRHFRLRGGRTVLQLGWLKQQRDISMEEFHFGGVPLKFRSCLLDVPGPVFRTEPEETLRRLCAQSLGIPTRVLKPTHRLHRAARESALCLPQALPVDEDKLKFLR